MTHWTERHRVLLAVFVVLRKGGRILLARRAGHADGHESAIAALMREAKEEIGVDIRPADLHLVHTMHRQTEEGTHEYIDLFFEATKWRGEPAIMEPDKCNELTWADVRHLPDDVIPAVRAALGAISRGEPYSDSNF